ncbi:ABC transporter permease [Halalkalibacter urbisdiaboli]|uniref:ABC transporter permease n=1 Tax=Halalkalibacter urbisdiaboli TaxID=1960589 RepID=UPI000B43D787|nr:iron ABC transporter permease [Halalkalibacter urbisdiaboli]
MTDMKQGRRLFKSSFFSITTKAGKQIWLTLSFVLIFIFFLVPIIRLFLLSLSVEGGHIFSNYYSILHEARTWKIIANTAIIVVGSTTIALVVGVLLAWLISYSDIRAKRWLILLVMIPFIIPSYIVTLSWTQFLSKKGWLAQGFSQIMVGFEPFNLYSHTGIIIILGLSHYPLVFLLTMSVLRRIPRELEWAVQASGGNRWTVFRKITLPLALPGIASGGMLAFLANLDNFGIPAFLGIPAKITVLSTAIYQEVVGFGPTAFARAATFSVILAIIALIGTVLQWFFLRKANYSESVIDKRPRVTFGKKRILIEISLWAILIFISIIPLFSMFATSVIRAYGLPFTIDNITFNHYKFLLLENSKVQGAILTSIKLAIGTSLFCLFAGTALAYYRIRRQNRVGKGMELSVGLPYALPGMVLALAMILSWMQPIPGWNPGIYGSIWILFIAYITRFMILQVRGSMTAMSQIDPAMEEAAQVFGAKGFSKWRKIMLPLLLPGLLSGTFLVMLTALTELTVSALLWSSGSETIGLTIFNFEQAGYTTFSTAFSSLIVVALLMGGLSLIWLQGIYQKKVGQV